MNCGLAFLLFVLPLVVAHIEDGTTSAHTSRWEYLAGLAAKKCAAAFKVDLATINRVLIAQERLPDNKNLNCAIDCFVEQVSINKDGKIREEILDVMEFHRAEMPQARKVLASCQRNRDESKECWMGKMFLHCYHRLAVEVDPPAKHVDPDHVHIHTLFYNDIV